MSNKASATAADLKKLSSFLRKNSNVDFRKVDLVTKKSIDSFKWPGSQDEKEKLLKLVKAYQRILRVLPENYEHLARSLLKKGINSSMQIASMPKKKFIQDNIKIFENDTALAEQVYKRAIALRKAIALKYINRSQSLEPHARAVGIR